ncbi:MAG: ABC transporter ATP-binding protein [Candidatus Saccharibacteria bacterium]
MTDKQIAVDIIDIHKEFILPQNKNSTFKQTVVNIVKQNKKVTQKVLDGVSFQVNKGDFFGIVGRNGSGKSTLLKLIAGVYTPTAGHIAVNGGLTPFIELGVGFNPELSGRDNVYLNGALLGFTHKQMDSMYDEIVDFAELGPFMDQKLKNYSSGMQVRLAFSIAIKAKNEILIFDEVLAVGDEAFQRKCLNIFEQYRQEGQTVILVTHDMSTVRRFCNRVVLIDCGKVVDIGGPDKVASEYSRLNQ